MGEENLPDLQILLFFSNRKNTEIHLNFLLNLQNFAIIRVTSLKNLIA